jgi:hypothetical protein
MWTVDHRSGSRLDRIAVELLLSTPVICEGQLALAGYKLQGYAEGSEVD